MKHHWENCVHSCTPWTRERTLQPSLGERYNMVWELEHLTFKDRLKGSSLFIVEKRWLRVDLTAVFNYLKGNYRVFSWTIVSATKWYSTKYICYTIFGTESHKCWGQWECSDLPDMADDFQLQLCTPHYLSMSTKVGIKNWSPKASMDRGPFKVPIWKPEGSETKYSICFCGGLTLAGRQVPTKAALALPVLSWTGERKCNERLVGPDKDREITHQA
ncbi:hypothetical protein QYF61_022258 [Mycteria americana]|uniref:Uncharacterized protein n=1 Tax=Mycteria americana TaxID=33587 RepID=A0AAN7MYM4_MYCAM|nr:hypothetical protein QYF61_022258 [Mycteria americana]